MARLLRALESRRDDLVASAVPGGFESFLQDYALVGVGDLFSLVF